MNYLKGKRCYLSGVIEFDKSTTNWRIEPKKFLAELGIDVFDPFAHTKQKLVTELNKAKQKRDFETIRKIARMFVKKDLHETTLCHFILSYVPKNTVMCGTWWEIHLANSQKKPCLLVSDGDKLAISTWIFGIIRHESIYNNWEEAFSYLREVNAGLHKSNERWSDVYGLLD